MHREDIMTDSQLDDYFGEFVTETDDAIKVFFGHEKEEDGNDPGTWIPKQNIVYEVDDNTGNCIVTAPYWLAYKKGMI